MSSPSDLDEKSERALRAHGLDLCEHYVLCTAQGESPAPRSQFVAFSKELADGDPRGTFPLVDHERALARLLARGLLVTIGRADVQRDEAFPGPRPTYELDDVCFSEEGYRVHAEVIREIFARNLRRKPFAVVRRSPAAVANE